MTPSVAGPIGTVPAFELGFFSPNWESRELSGSPSRKRVGQTTDNIPMFESFLAAFSYPAIFYSRYMHKTFRPHPKERTDPVYLSTETHVWARPNKDPVDLSDVVYS